MNNPLPDKLKSTELWIKGLPNIITAILAGIAVFYVSDQPTDASVGKTNDKLDKMLIIVTANQKNITRIENTVVKRTAVVRCANVNFRQLFREVNTMGGDVRQCLPEDVPD